MYMHTTCRGLRFTKPETCVSFIKDSWGFGFTQGFRRVKPFWVYRFGRGVYIYIEREVLQGSRACIGFIVGVGVEGV